MFAADTSPTIIMTVPVIGELSSEHGSIRPLKDTTAMVLILNKCALYKYSCACLYNITTVCHNNYY